MLCQESIRTQNFSDGFKIDMVEPFRGSLRFAEILEQERVPISELIPWANGSTLIEQLLYLLGVVLPTIDGHTRHEEVFAPVVVGLAFSE